MNNTDTQDPENTAPDSDRPFGYWLKAVDRLMAAEFAASFESEHASRRDWRLLNAVDGTVTPRRPLTRHKLHALVERGWIAAEGDGWTLTDEGRDAKDRLGGIVDGIRAKVADAVSPEDLATTIASLEQIARVFGWDEGTPLPRGRTHGRRFGRRGFGHQGGPFGGPFGPGFGPDAEHGDHDRGHRGHGRFRPGPGLHPFAEHDTAGREHGGHDCGHRGHGHPDHRGHGGARAARMAQHAFERGFDTGYSRGRDS